MADRVLRDHDYECSHGTKVSHLLTGTHGYEESDGVWCPGGRDITIDWEAAKKAAEGYELPMSALAGIVVAAIGDGDE